MDLTCSAPDLARTPSGHRGHLGRYLGIAVASAAAAGIVWAAYLTGEASAIRSLRESADQRLATYSAALESELRRFERLPRIVAMDPRVQRVLIAPKDSEAIKLANDYLEGASERAGSAAIYAMDRDGTTLASSNWRATTSFVGKTFGFRPYFQDAIGGRQGRFYGVGTVTQEPGYFLADAVRIGADVTGVAAVKIRLDTLDARWAGSNEKLLVVDGHGIVFLSSEPRWKFKTLRGLSQEVVDRLTTTRQYGGEPSLPPLGVQSLREIDDTTAVIALEADDPGALAPTYMAHHGPVADTGWRLYFLADMSPVRATARNSAIVAALVLGVVALLGLHLQQRARSAALASAARSALQRVNDELEQKVSMRTLALSDANGRLQDEVAERQRAEQTLQSTLGDLVQTAKMAVLGQMSASVTHELNQPLAALRTLSDNTLTLLERQRYEDAKDNLRMIGKTTARLGDITGQLKQFARRCDGGVEAEQIDEVLADAMLLVRQHLQSRHIRLEQSLVDGGVRAFCHVNGLEQVLINLLSNAADAVEGVADPLVDVVLRRDGAFVLVEVHDNGPGIGEHAAHRLFEPFFTTKHRGAGLGLGLAVSNEIVGSFGATLSFGRSGRLGGAVFTVRLRADDASHA